jgi:hypothetical protein
MGFVRRAFREPQPQRKPKRAWPHTAAKLWPLFALLESLQG